MKNTETKQEWVLNELRKVQNFYQDRAVVPGRINIHQMVRDSADVIEDLQKEIAILQGELMAEKIAHRDDIQIMGSGPLPASMYEALEADKIREAAEGIIGIDLSRNEGASIYIWKELLK